MDGKTHEDGSRELSDKERFRNLFNAFSEDELGEDDPLPDAEAAKLMIALRLVDKQITAEEFIEVFKTPPAQVEEATQSVISEKIPHSDKSPH